eukprot:5585653-Prymnesium_polylepis.1
MPQLVEYLIELEALELRRRDAQRLRARERERRLVRGGERERDGLRAVCVCAGRGQGARVPRESSAMAEGCGA